MGIPWGAVHAVKVNLRLHGSLRDDWNAEAKCNSICSLQLLTEFGSFICINSADFITTVGETCLKARR